MFLSHFVYSCTLLRLLSLLSIYNIIYGNSHSQTDCCICEETPTDSYETSVNSIKALIQICLGPENLHNSLSLVDRSLPSKFSRESLLHWYASKPGHPFLQSGHPTIRPFLFLWLCNFLVFQIKEVEICDNDCWWYRQDTTNSEYCTQRTENFSRHCDWRYVTVSHRSHGNNGKPKCGGDTCEISRWDSTFTVIYHWWKQYQAD